MKLMMFSPQQNLESIDLVEITVTQSAGVVRQHTGAGWIVSACLHATVIYALFDQFQVLAQVPSLSGQRRVASVELVASWQAASESLPTTVAVEQVELPLPEEPQAEVSSSRRETPPVKMVSETRLVVSEFGTLPPPVSQLVRPDRENPAEAQAVQQTAKPKKQITPAELSQASSQAAAPPQNAGSPNEHWKAQWSPLPYPNRSLILQGVGGRVELLVSVRADGRVERVKLHRSSGRAVFDEAALVSVRRWRYAPPIGAKPQTGATFLQPVVYDPARAAR